jgi:hypothetical protein
MKRDLIGRERTEGIQGVWLRDREETVYDLFELYHSCTAVQKDIHHMILEKS